MNKREKNVGEEEVAAIVLEKNLITVDILQYVLHVHL